MDQRGRWPRRPPRSNYPVRNNEWLSYQYERSERIDADVELAEKISALEDKLKKQDEKLLALKNKVDEVAQNVKKATQKSNAEKSNSEKSNVEKSNTEKSNKEKSNTAGHIDTSLPPESLEQGTTSPESLEDRLAGSLLKVLKILECAVCLEVVKIPFKECQRGHLICSECVESLPNCPTCQGALSLENPVCMKNLLEVLPRPCRFQENGCKEMPELKGDHESFCGFRVVYCRICGEKIHVRTLKEHVDNKHDGEIMVSQKGRVLLTDIRSSSDLDATLSFFVMGTFFWLCITESPLQGLVDITWDAYFINKPKHDYFISLTLFKDGVGTVVSMKTSSEETTCSTIVSFVTLDRCINDEGYMSFDYEVVAKPDLRMIKNKLK